jgi:GNAT superfamily N-acetyltransferase
LTTLATPSPDLLKRKLEVLSFALGQLKALHLRAETVHDRPFLLALYGDVRAAELDQVAWPAGQREAFIASQFQAREHHYRTHYHGAQFLIISEATKSKQPIGYVFLHVTANDLRIMDIALIPTVRGKGLGSQIMGAIHQVADQFASITSLHVEPDNPAKRLYERMGYSDVENRGAYVYMERSNQ